MAKQLQHPKEIAAFADLVAKEGARSFLEIGSKYGGSISVVARAMPKGSRIVSVDLCRNGDRLPQAMAALKSEGYDTHQIEGDSTHDASIEAARKLGPYDVVFIDGDHKLPGVTADWNNYGPMGRIIAFHDIGWHREPDWTGPWIIVPQFWDSIKGPYCHVEFKMCETGCNAGIGVLWR